MAVKPCVWRGPDFFCADAVDIRFALGEGFDFALINVEAGDGEFLFAEQQGQRQSHVAQADNADPRLALLDLALELIGRTFCGGVIVHHRNRVCLPVGY